MKLLLLRQCIGLQEHGGWESDELTSVATNLPLGEALVELSRYEKTNSVYFTLLSVSEIEYLDESQRWSLGDPIELVEEMIGD